MTVHELAFVARAASRALVFYQYILTVMLVPVYVAGGIALERERRTLGDLLLTRLSSAEIVLGKLAAGLIEFATTLAIGLPAMAIMFLSGLDAGIIVLACAGIASTAYVRRWAGDPDFERKPAKRAGQPRPPSA